MGKDKKGLPLGAIFFLLTNVSVKNFAIISEFTKSSGQIISARETGLRPVNQRKIAKMVRRAQGMGIYPSIHKHPDMIRRDFYPHGMGR